MTPALSRRRTKAKILIQHFRLAEGQVSALLSALVTPVLTIAALSGAHQFGEAALLSDVERPVQRLRGRDQLVKISGSLRHPLRPHLQPVHQVMMLVLILALFSPGG